MANLTELQKHWEEDSRIDNTQIAEESIKIPTLHNKYYKLLLAERKEQRKQEILYKQEILAAYNYYKGDYDQNNKRFIKLGPQPKKLIKDEIKMYLDADVDVQTLDYQLFIQKEKIEFLLDVMRQLNNRGFQIKNFIEWQKFINGGS